MDSTLTNLSAAQLRRAAELKEQIESLQSELSGILGGSSYAVRRVSSGRGGGKRTFSPAALERIRAAQRARWAAHRAARGGKTGSSKAKGSRKMSAAARARLAAVAKARWAKVKASGRNAL